MKNIIKMFENLTRDYRKQVSKQQYSVPIVIIAIITIIGLSMTACGEDDSNSSNKGGSIKVEQLPEFPSGSNPAESKADAEAILAELRKTRVIESVGREKWDVIHENANEEYYNFSFNNRSLPGGSVKVSASHSENETYTGGFKKLNEYYENEEERNKIQFNKGDRYNYTLNENRKAELIKAKTEDGITIANGSIFEVKQNDSYYSTVSTAGSYSTFRTNISRSYKYQEIYAFTVTTSSGSVKVIFDRNVEWGGVGNNVLDSDKGDDVGTWTETGEKFSGSLKVFGSNNVLLIDHSIVDRASYEMALYMINYDPYTLNPADAIPLTNNVKVNGSTSQDSVALYSINVTSGSKYYLWWDDDNGFSQMSIIVRGYSDGNVFFDIGGEWNLGRWENDYSFTASSTSTVYIMVCWNGGDGDFSIVYNTSGNRPAMSVSATPFRANSGSIQNKMNVGVLRYNKR